jgi:PTH1 family peptidyl-tRNA hydrolase
VLLMKPQTYMNNSGEAVGEAMRFYKLTPDRLIVLSDDISLKPGGIRIRKKGSAGGHNGLKSIIAHIGSDAFPRVKLGIGGKPEQWDLADWVLAPFMGDDAKAFEQVLDKMEDLCALLVQGKTDEAMNRYNKTV